MRSQSDRSFTDDLPVCKLSGIGYSTNQVYREDGHRIEEHSYEDRSFYYKLDNNTALYGVIDGYNGSAMADIGRQRMIAEILFGQLSDNHSDEDVKELLRQAFLSVEKEYLDSIDDKLAVKYELTETSNSDPRIREELEAINRELSCGMSAVVALIHNQVLYIANVGDCRALLCKTDMHGNLRVVQLSTDHDLSNEDELLRLSRLGLNIENIRSVGRLGNQKNTRCLGNFMVKNSYKDFAELASSRGQPVIALPEISNGTLVDDSCQFLLLMSGGLYKSLEEATKLDRVNTDIVRHVANQFKVQQTLTGVAQAVVDFTARVHHDQFMSEQLHDHRDDITLLVRNFGHVLPNAKSSPSTPLSMRLTSSSHSSGSAMDTTTLNGTSSSSEMVHFEGNSEERLPAYVQFADYYERVEKARREGTLPDGIDFG